VTQSHRGWGEPQPAPAPPLAAPSPAPEPHAAPPPPPAPPPAPHPVTEAVPGAVPAPQGWAWDPRYGWIPAGAPPGPWTPPAPKPPIARPSLQGEQRRRARIELAMVFFVTALPSLVMGFTLVGTPSPAPDLPDSWVKLVALFLAALGPAAIVVYLLWREGELRAGGFGPIKPWPFLWQTALALVSFLVAQFVVAIVIAVILAALGQEPSVERPEIDFTGLYVASGILLSLSAGIGEEFVFRAYAITRMEDAGWPRLAIWVPVAVWSLLHLYQGWRGPVILFATALPWVFLFRWKRSVWPLVAAHFFYDMLVFLVFQPA